ncbi:hypothetical protein CYMTET_23701 [Cymbomonas tetramitiformis]|uniref:Uncharacterized protein n=1 Tax=Cymbomonas tetramitiformis TaxID=36881 RepID=A0AAE0FXU5_9CHLO|nr:hypothetical protein CYMTET_23701 [Cymbomonas tetramitiformis]
MKYDEVVAGARTIPLLALSDVTCKVEKFYPVTDGEGGHGEVFNTNAAAQEFLHLGEGRMMLAAYKSEDDARDELDNYGARRAPPARPPARTHKTVTRDGEGPCGHAPRPETASTPLRLIHQTWPEGHFDPHRQEYQPPVFQGICQAESDTNIEDTAQESTWLDPVQIAELAQRDGQTVFLVPYRYQRGKVFLMLGKPNAERGKGQRTCELSSKLMHRYSSSAALGQRGEYLPLGGQSAGGSGGLLSTIRQHVADICTGEELTDLARLHLIEGPQQGTLRVLRTRATPRTKAVHYLCEAHSFYHQRGSYGVAFKPEYLASVTRKFDMCSWVTCEKAAVMHRAPLSALVTQVESALHTEHLRAHLARTFMNDLTAAAEADSPASAGAPPSPAPSTTSGVSSLFGETGGDFRSSSLFIGPEMLQNYMFIRSNWKYDFLRPSVQEIVTAYKMAHAKSMEDESDASDESEES